MLTDFVCLYYYEFWLSLCKIVRSSVILLLPLFRGLEPGRKWGAANFCVESVLLIFSALCNVVFVFILCLVCPVLPMSLECPFLVASSVFSNVAPFPLFRFSYIACLSYFPVHFENPLFSGKLLQLYSYFPVHPCTSDTEVLPANRVFVWRDDVHYKNYMLSAFS